MPTTDKYRAEPANGGERSVILDGWVVKIVCMDNDHAELAGRVAELLNREEAELSNKKESVQA